MYKASYKDVKALQSYAFLEGQSEVLAMMQADYQPSGHVLAYYSPSQANWSYQIGIYTVNGITYELLTRFGSVEGGRKLYSHDNTFEVQS